MDVEIRNLFEEIMEKMHQITWWYSELAKQEIKGVKIPRETVFNYKPINMLFSQVQGLYRNLQDSLITSMESEKGKYDESNEVALEDYLLEMSLAQLQEHMNQSYARLNYISFMDPDTQIPHKSIYTNHNFNTLHNTEFSMLKANFINLKDRIDSLRYEDKFSFTDKGRIMECVSMNKFYENFVFDVLDECQHVANEDIENVLEIQKIDRLERLIEYKYSRYFMYMNNKYNGFIQKDDVDKFGTAEYAIKNDLARFTFDMTQFELDENIDRYIQVYADVFHEELQNVMRLRGLRKKTRPAPTNKQPEEEKGDEEK